MGGRPTGHPQRPRGPGAAAHIRQPVPVVVRIVWEHDGEEHIETVALGWTGQRAYIRLPDPRYRFTAVWLNVTDVKRR
jgi:hypothetical protein